MTGKSKAASETVALEKGMGGNSEGSRHTA